MIPGVQYICVHQCGLEKWGAAWHANAEMCCGSFWRGIGAQLHCLYVQAPRVQVIVRSYVKSKRKRLLHCPKPNLWPPRGISSGGRWGGG